MLLRRSGEKNTVKSQDSKQGCTVILIEYHCQCAMFITCTCKTRIPTVRPEFMTRGTVCVLRQKMFKVIVRNLTCVYAIVFVTRGSTVLTFSEILLFSTYIAFGFHEYQNQENTYSCSAFIAAYNVCTSKCYTFQIHPNLL